MVELKQLTKQMGKFNYVSEYHDCDNAAFEFKGLADYSSNAVGVVIGRATAWHAWNCAITDEGVFMIEPQTGEIFKTKKNYKAWVIII